MKIKQRALSLLLALAMVLAYMPALAFAEGEDQAIDNVEIATEKIFEAPAEEVAANTEGTVKAAEVKKAELVLTDTEYSELNMLWDEWYSSEESEYLYSVYYETGDILRLYTSDTEYTEYTYSKEDSDTGFGEYVFVNGTESKSLYNLYYWTAERITAGTYEFYTCDYSNEFEVTVDITVTAYEDEDEVTLLKAKNDAWYEFEAAYNQKYDLCRATQQAELDTIWSNVSDTIWNAEDIATVNSILSSAKAAISAVKTNAQLTAEEQAAAAAAVEAARQGTYTAGLPKVKISKPKAAKKSITVKWKKLNKKQLKSGVSKIEIWVCPNSAFGAGDTIIKFAGKKKASFKVKGLAKGTYFVKVRAIKEVGGVKYYTAWSSVKTVKVKK